MGLRWVFGVVAVAFSGIALLSRLAAGVDCKNREL